MRLPARLKIAFVLLSLSCTGTAPASDSKTQPAPDVVAVLAGKNITQGELDELAKERLASVRSAEYRIKRQVLEEHITRRVVEQEAKARGITVEELERLEIDAKVEPVTEEQKRAVYQAGDGEYEGLSESVALARIEATLKRRRAADVRRKFVEELRAKAGVQVFLPAPVAVAGAGVPGAAGGAAAAAAPAARVSFDNDGAYARGPASAPVTLVEFSDFQCPYCSRVNEMIKRIEDNYRDKVRFVFRNFPLSMHRFAQKSAEAARCAGEQGKFWEMHGLLFADQKALQLADLKQRAATLGLKQAQFDECLESGRQAAPVGKDVADGRRAGVTGTPTFFVNGQRVGGAKPYETFASLIDQELVSRRSAVSQELAAAK